MAVNQFNLQPLQRAERKQLITVVEWKEGTETYRELLGTRTEDSSIELNPDTETTTDIRGNTWTDVNKTEPAQDFDPFLVLGSSRLGALLYDIVMSNKLNEMQQFTVYVISTFIGSEGLWDAVKHENCLIEVQSIGGDASVNMPITVHLSNKLTRGTVDKISEDFVFTADTTTP